MTAVSPAWIALARSNTPIIQAADAMKCSKATAARMLELAQGILGSRATRRQEAAVALLQHSGLARPEISKRRWPDVVLGLARAA